MPVAIPGFTPTRKFIRLGDDQYQVITTPPAIIGGEGIAVNLNLDQAWRCLLWLDGKGLIQDLLPDLSVADREALLTGLPSDALSAAE